MEEKAKNIIFGVHSNVYHENEKPGVGHCWVSVDKNGQIETYGSFPKNDPDVQDYGQEEGWNKSGTSVQKNVELNLDMQSVSHKFYELTKDQQGVLDQLLNEPHDWSHRENNCSTWAAKVASDVTGERISSEHSFPDRVDPEIIHIVDAPQGVSKSIQELEQQKAQESKDTGITAAQQKSAALQEAKNNQAELNKRAEITADLEKENADTSKIEAKDFSVDVTPDKEDFSNEMNDDLNKDKIEQLDKINPERDSAIAELQEARGYVSSLEEQQTESNKEHEGR